MSLVVEREIPSRSLTEFTTGRGGVTEHIWGLSISWLPQLCETSVLPTSPKSCTPQPFPLHQGYFHPQRIQRVLDTELSKSISKACQNNRRKRILNEHILWSWALVLSQQLSALGLGTRRAILGVGRGQGKTPLTISIKDSPRC